MTLQTGTLDQIADFKIESALKSIFMGQVIHGIQSTTTTMSEFKNQKIER